MLARHGLFVATPPRLCFVDNRLLHDRNFSQVCAYSEGGQFCELLFCELQDRICVPRVKRVDSSKGAQFAFVFVCAHL